MNIVFDSIDQKETVFAHSGWMTYLGVMAISLWGGVVSYLEKRPKFSWQAFLAHLSSSSFAGMMTFFACEYAGVKGPLTGVLCGVAAHMGTPALIALAMKLKVVRNLLAEEKNADNAGTTTGSNA